MAAIGQTFPPGSNVRQVPQPALRQFLQVHPKALGTVQIMIGLVTILFGIVLVSDPPFSPISVLSGNVYWASIVYIIAGSLSVAAESNLHSCLVQGSLGMNVVSAIFSAAGVGFLTTDLFLYYYCYPFDCAQFEARSKAISGVLLVFAILQFFVSICISAFACKATCCTEPMIPVTAYANQIATISPQVNPQMNPQVSVSMVPSQAGKGNPQTPMYFPQPRVNMNTPAPQNIYDWPHER